MAADSLKRIGDKICQDYLGFNPTSNSTKPPHIANGLFRACIGETCDTRDVHEWVISDGRKDALPSEKIVADYACILEKGEQEKPSNIKQFRSTPSSGFSCVKEKVPSAFRFPLAS